MRALLLPLIASLALTACAPANVRLPAALADQGLAYPVEGHSPRRWNQPLRIGPYRTVALAEGGEFSWNIGFDRTGFGRASRPYRYTMVSLGEAPVEVQCLSRSNSAWRAAARQMLEVDLSVATGAPKLQCGVRRDAREPVWLALVDTGRGFRGDLTADRDGYPLYTIRSLHQFEGSPFTSPEPLGYEILRRGEIVAVVETINAGRVVFAPGTREDERVLLAATSTALLMFDPEITSVDD